MLEVISGKIMSFICRHYYMPDDMKAVYQYGVELMLSSILNILLIIISAFLLGDVTAEIVFLPSFIPIRTYTGGYHANSYLRCNVTFVGIFFLVWLGSKLLIIYCTVTFQFINIVFLQAPLSGVVNYDTEGTDIKKIVSDSNQELIVVSKVGMISIIWYNTECMFTLEGNLLEKELSEMLNGTKLQS